MPRAKKSPAVYAADEERSVAGKKPRYACSEDAEWGGFLNVRLDEDGVDDFHAWYAAAQHEVGWVLFAEAVQAGIKFSLTFDGAHNAWIATFTGDLLGSGDRRAMTSRAPTWSQAVLLQTWKHAIHLNGDYTSTVTPKGNYQQFG